MRRSAMALVGPMVGLMMGISACDEGPSGLPPLEVESVEVMPADRALTVGDTMMLVAHPRTTDGDVLGSVTVTWSVGAGEIASLEVVNGYARIIALAPGEVEVVAEAEGKRGVAAVEVTPLPLVPAALDLTPQSARLDVDSSIALEARLRTADGTMVGGRTVTWTSSHGPAATVHPDVSTTFGVVTGLKPGTVRITARAEGLEASVEVTVEPLP